MEQPFNSLLFLHRPMADSLRMVMARRVLTYLSAFGSETLKPLELWSTLPELDGVIASFRAGMERLATIDKKLLSRVTPKSKAQAKKSVRKTACKQKRGWSTQGWVTGNKTELKESQEYPPEFVTALASAVLRAWRAAPSTA